MNATQEDPNQEEPKAAEKPVEKAAEKPADKPMEKSVDKPGESSSGKFLLISLVFFVVVVTAIAGTFAYLYIDKRSENADLKSRINDLEETQDSEAESLAAQVEELNTTVDELEAENKTLTAENKTLDTDLKAYKAQAVRASRYDAVLKMLHQLITQKGGFTGWTEADYQTGRALAVATGDQGLIDAVDDAWHDLDGDPVMRVNRVLREIEEGIDANV